MLHGYSDTDAPDKGRRGLPHYEAVVIVAFVLSLTTLVACDGVGSP